VGETVAFAGLRDLGWGLVFKHEILPFQLDVVRSLSLIKL
jgi:hypothetical protein